MRMKRMAVALAVALAMFGCKRAEKADTGAGSGKAEQQARGGQQTPAATTTGTEVGAMMPEYAAMWLDGSKFELAEKKGQVVLLNAWATWCGPCRLEIPHLQHLHNQYAARNFAVIGVSVDDSGVEPVRDFVQEQKMTYPVAIDAEAKLLDVLRTTMLPTSVVLDRNGKIVWKKVGWITPEDTDLVKAIEDAL